MDRKLYHRICYDNRISHNDQDTFDKSNMILVIYLVAHATVVTCLIAL